MARLIDADALIDKAETVLDEHETIWFDAVSVNNIHSAPTIDAVSVVHGEWITIDTEVISVPVYWNKEQRQSDERGAGISEKCECSVCGWRKIFMGYKKMGVNKSYNFCPNCGAKMREVRDE